MVHVNQGMIVVAKVVDRIPVESLFTVINIYYYWFQLKPQKDVCLEKSFEIVY